MRPVLVALSLVVLLGCVSTDAKASRKLLDGDVKGQSGQADAAQAAVQAAVQALSAWSARISSSNSFGIKASRFFTDLSTRITAHQGTAPGAPLTPLSLPGDYAYYTDDATIASYYSDALFTELSDDTTCRVDADGSLLVRSSAHAFIDSDPPKPCDLRLEGFDARADLLPGGLDGTYRLTGCLNGAPLFSRAGVGGAADRWLFFSQEFGDWSLARGERPNEDDILVFGFAGLSASELGLRRAGGPMDVTGWQVGGDLVSAAADDHSRQGAEYVPAGAGVRVSCAGPAEKARVVDDEVMAEAAAVEEAQEEAAAGLAAADAVVDDAEAGSIEAAADSDMPAVLTM